MKKSLIALALVAGFAQANETTLYGRVVGDTQFVKKPGEKFAADVDTTVRFGIKGNEDLNAGLKAIYQMEFNYKFGNNAGALGEIRQGYVGLQGDFGTIKVGKQSTVHGLLTGKADYSNAFGGAYNEGGSRLAKAISYASPDFGGVTVAGAIVVDGSGQIVSAADSKSVRAFEVGAQYAANGLEVAATYAQVDSVAGVKNPKYFGASAAYNAGSFGVGFDFERQADLDKYFALAGEYKFTEQDRVYAGVELLNKHQAEDIYFGHLGYEHKLSKRTKTWAEIGGAREKLSGFTKSKNGFVASVGLRHDF